MHCPNGDGITAPISNAAVTRRSSHLFRSSQPVLRADEDVNVHVLVLLAQELPLCCHVQHLSQSSCPHSSSARMPGLPQTNKQGATISWISSILFEFPCNRSRGRRTEKSRAHRLAHRQPQFFMTFCQYHIPVTVYLLVMDFDSRNGLSKSITACKYPSWTSADNNSVAGPGCRKGHVFPMRAVLSQDATHRGVSG